jgi:hypothetical protein
MKKIFLLLLITPIFTFAKFYKGNVTFNDGTIKNGYLEIPEYSNDNHLKFKADEKGKTEKLSIDLIRGFEIINLQKETIKYLTLLLAEPKPFTNVKFKLNSSKSWVRIIKEGKVSVYSVHEAYNNSTKTGGGSAYYIKKENEEHATFIADGPSGGLSINMNGFSVFKSCIKSIFENDCPKLFGLLEKDDFKKKGIEYIVDLYEQNCN